MSLELNVRPEITQTEIKIIITCNVEGWTDEEKTAFFSGVAAAAAGQLPPRVVQQAIDGDVRRLTEEQPTVDITELD